MMGSNCKARLACLIVGCSIIIAHGLATAVPLKLPSGKVIDLSPRQVEMLQRSPGVYYFEAQPDKFLDMRLRHWILLELPPGLGGGFIIATPQNLAQGLDMIDADRQNEAAMALAMKNPEVSDSAVGVKAAESGDKVRFAYQQNWQWSFDIGYRNDDLDWNIAGDIYGNNPNILSELTWEDLEILQFEFGLERRSERNFILQGTLAYGVIFGGENQDSDYLGDNRTFEFSRSNNSADSGQTFDVSIGLGRVFPLFSKAFSATPLAGFSFQAQNLTITDGFQTIPPLGSFPGLNSSYDARWYGPWLGLEFNTSLYSRDGALPAHEIIFGIEYHWADYYADANWNLRPDFAHPKSFEHEADGTGIILRAGFNYFFNRQWSLNVSGKYQKWETDPGIDRVFFFDGSEVETRLNEVNWKSFALMLGVSCSF